MYGVGNAGLLGWVLLLNEGDEGRADGIRLECA